MNEEIILPSESLEQSVAHISAKVADAIEMTQQAKYLSERSEETLKEAGRALEELYIGLGGAAETDVLGAEREVPAT